MKIELTPEQIEQVVNAEKEEASKEKVVARLTAIGTTWNIHPGERIDFENDGKHIVLVVKKPYSPRPDSDGWHFNPTFYLDDSSGVGLTFTK